MARSTRQSLIRWYTTRQIDNGLYDRLADTCWDENGFLNLLKSTVNPWRLPYFQRVIRQLRLDPHSARALDDSILRTAQGVQESRDSVDSHGQRA